MTTDVMVDRALGRAVVARCLKLGLAPPSRRLDSLFSERARDTLGRAARSVSSDDGALSLAVDRLTAERFSRSLSELERTFDWLFGHSLRGRTCPYETEYGKREPVRQAHELSDIAGFYRAFGLEPNGASERCDHIACELEFLEILSAKEAYALEKRDDDMFDVTRHAARKFLREHIGVFGRGFGRALEEADEDGFYGRMGTLLACFLAACCREFDVPVGAKVLTLSSLSEDRVPMACGSGVETPPDGPFEI